MVLTAPFDKGSNSTLMNLSGKLMWCRLTDLNRYGKWSLDLYPDNESLEKLRELQAEGVKNVIKKDDDGYHVQISRPSTVEFQKGVVQSVTPPRIRDKDKQPLPANVLVGNGSDGVVTVEVYTHRVPNSEKRAKAMRLYGVEVHNLIPFELTEEKAQEENSNEGWD
jgi:hypothetical protein